MFRTFIGSIFISLFVSSIGNANFHPNVIYGDDNRLDTYQVSDPKLRALADSTVAVMSNSTLKPVGTSRFAISTSVFGTEMGLCHDEPFWSQPTAAFCSGFLVGEDLVATAGHCINANSCGGISLVFGFKMIDAHTAVTEVDANEVYHCKEVVARAETVGADYSLIRLNRPVKNHSPLKMATHVPKENDSMTVIGHPSGLPTKIAGGAIVRNSLDEYFVSNLDTYGGNSGSAVFNANGEVQGILVRGETDFRYDSAAGCSKSNVCASNACRGEDSTHISFIVKNIH